MVRDHLVQPAHSTDENIKAQKKGGTPVSKGCSSAPPPSSHGSDLSLSQQL